MRHNYYLGAGLLYTSLCLFLYFENWGDAPLIKESVDVGRKLSASWQELADFAIGDLKLAVKICCLKQSLQDASGIR